MVHVYNCHPFASQQIVPTEQEPGLFCCGGDVLFVVSAGGCKIEAFSLQEDSCTPFCRFSTMGNVLRIAHSEVGDYLVTIEEKSSSIYLRAYTNWRCQTAEKTRVGVRLLGHFVRNSSFRSSPKEQMEIIEIPLSETPLCISCCPHTGDLLVGCEKNLIIFKLKNEVLHEQLSALDFERFLILHVPGWIPTAVCYCAGYIAVQIDLEVLVVKLEYVQKSSQDVSIMLSKDERTDDKPDLKRQASQNETDDFCIFQKHQEMLGQAAVECGVSVTPEKTGMDFDEDIKIQYILYRRFAPDFFQGHTVEETRLRSLSLLPIYRTGNSNHCGDARPRELLNMLCFFSLPNTGYLYSLKSPVELISNYQYPEKALAAVLSTRFLYVITSHDLQCFTVRCSALAARLEDPYMDTTMRTCPPTSLEVCALRIQLFIGLQALCLCKNHLILLTKVDVDSDGRDGKVTRSTLSKKASFKKKTPEGGHGWNLYIVDNIPVIQLYREMIDYSKKYSASNSQSQNCVHLLCEAHLLLRAALMDPMLTKTDEREELMAAFRESCILLGDCYSRLDTRESHLALPYYKMSGWSMTDIINRNLTFSQKAHTFGKGFMFYLKNSLCDETGEELSTDIAEQVLTIFSSAEPSQLPHIVCSPSMINANPATTFMCLERWEAITPSVTVTLTKAATALKMKDLQLYKRQMDRHAEMLQVYGFIEEPKLLIHRTAEGIKPTALACHLRETQDGLLVAATVALHENGKMKLTEADVFFKVMCKETGHTESEPQLLVDFWEALLVASAQESIIQDLLFKLVSVYIHRISVKENLSIKPLKTAEDLINSSTHYGLIFPWVTVITPAHFNIAYEYQEDLQKLQALLCGPSLEVSSIFPLLEHLSDKDNAGFSIHVLCASKQGQCEHAIVRLLDTCPEAIMLYANHELHHDKQALWWQKLLPEVCERIKSSEDKSDILLFSLKETLSVIAMELNPLDFLRLMPDDGMAAFFLPYLFECSQKSLITQGECN
ncbi:Hermansky-Pudlak syndrome 3 protein isoform X1 [Erpetoichthys calabaricus]|uniref:Hermansky-Pudlak syndrome 3 protein isoform X1 n=2 Tax=Erpetoichthys calabaricus TaxID=27687 RepID=UPI0022340FAA|nr:Hermansky-Pudlak syndrome 3 protein isoform X1 [Erpetoichthys calabaricus]